MYTTQLDINIGLSTNEILSVSGHVLETCGVTSYDSGPREDVT